jgi:hypothetical protein
LLVEGIDTREVESFINFGEELVKEKGKIGEVLILGNIAHLDVIID